MRRIFYIGDSTVQFNKIDTYPQTGMSQALELYTAADVQVVHCGKNGRSTSPFWKRAGLSRCAGKCSREISC